MLRDYQMETYLFSFMKLLDILCLYLWNAYF